MTVNELVERLQLTPVALPDGDREVAGAYVGDLLSWVMGRAQSGNVWVTIMSNLNIVAVASLADVSCVVLAERVTLDESIAKTAEEKDVNVLSTAKTAYEVAAALAELRI